MSLLASLFGRRVTDRIGHHIPDDPVQRMSIRMGQIGPAMESYNWLRVFVFENTRAHSDASPRVISGGDMRGKATDTHGAW